MFRPNIGLPGITAERTAVPLDPSQDLQYAMGGRILDGTKSRDTGNVDAASSYRDLRAGLLLGKITANGKYTNSVIGTVQTALTNTATTLALTPAAAAEVVRRIGASGNLILTGPPTANGVARQVTVAYSAVDTTTGDVTITAAGVNAVYTLNFANSPAGTFRLRITDLDGIVCTTDPITYSATIGTLLTNINNALNASFGSGLIVASGTLVTAVAITFSGAGYTALPQTLALDSDGLTAGRVAVTQTTTGRDGRFVAGSFVGDTDGSATPVSLIPPGWGEYVPEDGRDIPLARFPVSGKVEVHKLLPAMTDSGIKSWVMTSLRDLGTIIAVDLY